jgi:hypothetical protein
MKKLLLTTAMFVLLSAPVAIACSPAPSCWMQESREYLKSVCMGYAKDGKRLDEIATYVEEPQKIEAFGLACKRLGIKLPSK